MAALSLPSREKAIAEAQQHCINYAEWFDKYTSKVYEAGATAPITAARIHLPTGRSSAIQA